RSTRSRYSAHPPVLEHRSSTFLQHLNFHPHPDFRADCPYFITDFATAVKSTYHFEYGVCDHYNGKKLNHKTILRGYEEGIRWSGWLRIGNANIIRTRDIIVRIGSVGWGFIGWRGCWGTWIRRNVSMWRRR